ncbi:tail fiber protein [Aquimarina sp. Aq78]|uniref:tail fiber protein n=1 Tax=Aquimarina sp. Aq78 TaxID=1191889 RepID=UPI000D0E7498|nr:tail fiber protein [Aquimarina sp. Aq78]
MKKSIFLSVSFVLVSLISTAQNNTFPTTGNVGIGVTSPTSPLQISSSNNDIIKLKTSDNEWLYTTWLDNTNTRRTWMGLNSDLSSFNIKVENGTNKILFNGGNVGIGTTTPTAKLHIKDPEGGAAFNIERGGKIWNFSIQHTGNNLFLNNSDTPNTFFTFTKDGKFGIGTTTPDSKLAVNGKIHAKEVKVDLTGWPDYVFENDYSLPSLQEVEHHIVEEGHLPNIPSASEVEKNGIQLGEMNAKLLQKIEELTLYMIAQNKKTEQLQKEIELLKKKMK